MAKGPGNGSLWISTRYLFTTLILIATAIPMGFRKPVLSLHWDLPDVLDNIALYLPFGVAFAEAGVRSILLRAVLLSGAIETAQLFFAGRYSQPSDVIAGVIGSYLGTRLGLWFQFPNKIKLTWWLSIVALIAIPAWLVFCPTLARDIQPLFPISTQYVGLFVWSRTTAASVVGSLGGFAATGAPANTAFVALLASLTLGPFLSRNGRLRNIAVTAIAGISAGLLLIPRNPEMRPWCFVAAFAVSITFTWAHFGCKRL